MDMMLSKVCALRLLIRRTSCKTEFLTYCSKAADTYRKTTRPLVLSTAFLL